VESPSKSARKDGYNRFKRYLSALTAAAGAGLLRAALDPLIGDRSHLLVFTLGIAVAAWFGGLGPGLLATIVSGFAGWYFFTDPRYSLLIAQPADGLNLLLLGVCGVVISLLCEQLRGATRHATENFNSQKQTEVALRESEQRFRTLFEHAADGTFIATRDGKYVEVNARGLEMSGYTREELLGLRILDFVAPTDRERVAAETENVLSGRRSFGEWHFLRKDGSTFEGEVSARLLPDGRLLATVRDLTERRRLEAQFLQAQKLEGIGRLAGGVAHDFNNLLTIIGGHAQMALDEAPASHPLAESLDEILSAARRASGLTRQLLAFSRRQIIEAKDLDINEVVRDFEKMLRRLIGEDVELVLSLGSELGLFHADRSQIEQVLLNLAVNARDAMPLGGKLVIETSLFNADSEFSEAHLAVVPGPYVMLSVRDNGVGMSKEVQGHLFEPFFTTKEPGKGTGLGLSTVYGIIKQSGGSILVYSEPGLGTVFRMLFPVATGSALAEPVPVPVTDQSGTETILLVEDEPSVRKYVSQVLRRRGYVVLEAANGKEGLELAARTDGPIDLLLTDLVMPEMGGAELAARFRGDSARNTPVLCVSGYTDLLWRPEDPNVSFLQKPFSISDLLTRIRELLAGRRSASA